LAWGGGLQLGKNIKLTSLSYPIHPIKFWLVIFKARRTVFGPRAAISEALVFTYPDNLRMHVIFKYRIEA
jgi:hypothetical protein